MYGDYTDIRMYIEENKKCYVMNVSGKAYVWQGYKQSSVGSILKSLPNDGWFEASCGDGSKGEFEISMKLSPKELGELLIKVSYSKGSVTLDVTAASKAAESGILSRISDLKESLAARGVNLANVEVTSGNINYGEQSGRSHQGGRDAHNGENQRNGGFPNSADSLNAAETVTARETERREMLMNYMKTRRLLYRTI